MKNLLVILLLSCSTLISAQTTAIPDANFEQELIILGLDVVIDGQVLTANIDTLTFLDVSGDSITDLTGIEDFTSLTYLDCGIGISSGQNYLTSLNVTQNTALEFLECGYNMLSSLDVSQNILLEVLRCSDNQLTSLDITQNLLLTWLIFKQNLVSNIDLTQNTALITLYSGANPLNGLDVTQNAALVNLSCSYNQLSTLDLTQNLNLAQLYCGYNSLTNLDLTQNTSLANLSCYFNMLTDLDLSQNTALGSLFAYDNQLYCLNLKNGNNSNFQVPLFATNNPNLTCIEVDSVSWSSANWTSIDPQSYYSTNCGVCIVGIDELPLTTVNIHPNPTQDWITVSLEEAKTGVLRVLNSLGQVVLEDTFDGVTELKISLDGPSGLYFIQLEIDGQIITKKVVKE